MKKIIFCIFYFVCFDTIGQPSFNAPDTICVNSPVSITNTTTSASSYYWNFCVANIASEAPVGVNLGNISGLFQLPVFMDYVKYNENFYGFVINNFPGNLVRLDFGNSLLNTPTAISLGNFGGAVPDAAEGIQVVQSKGKWIAIIVGGNEFTGERISKLDFGADLTNLSPTPTNWANLGNLAYPVDLHVFNENDNWFGFTLNYANNSITRFDFGSNFQSAPIALNLGNIGNLNGPTGINAIKYNNNWFVFVTNEKNSTLSRLDFGNSLLNTPTGISLGNPGNTLSAPRDLYLMNFCGSVVGFVVNKNSNDIVRLNFNQGISSGPTTLSLGNIGNLNFPHSISKLFRVNNDLYSFITNVNNNSITRLQFSGCNNSLPNSAAVAPPVYSYSTPGTYNVSLTIDDGLPSQASICKTIVVLPRPGNVPYPDTSFCLGNTLNIASSISAPSYNWNTGATTKGIQISNGGVYSVATQYYGCTIRDTINAILKALPQVYLGRDTSLCSNSTYQLNAGNSGASYLWEDGTKSQTHSITSSGIYHVTVNLNGCSARDTINISTAPSQTFNLGLDTTVCDNQLYNINPNNHTLTYTWQDGSIRSSYPVTQAGIYYASASTCSGILKDTIKISINPSPQIFLGNDTTVCLSSGNKFILNASNAGSLYRWQDGSTMQNYSVNTSGKYFVSVEKNKCLASDTVNIQILSAQTFNLGLDTTVCDNTLYNINPNNQTLTYTWQDGSIRPSYPVTQAGIYFASASTCIGILKDTIAISLKPSPQIFLGNDTTICLSSGNKFILNAGNPGSIYSWQDGSTIQSYSVNTSGKYFVSVEKNKCLASDTVNIQTLSDQTFSLGKDTSFCNGSPITIRPDNANLLYTWQDGSRGSDFLTDKTGYYQAFAATCSGIARDTIFVLMKPKPVVFLGNDTTVCTNTTLILNAANPGSAYQWNDGTSSQTHVVGSYNKYFVTVENNGCKTSDSINIRYDSLPKFSLGPDKLLCVGDNLILKPVDDFSYPLTWKDGTTSRSIVVSNTGTYTASYTTLCGAFRDTIVIKSGVCEVFVPGAFTPNNDGKNDVFRVIGNMIDKLSFQIYNRWGEKIFETNNKSVGWDGNFHGIMQNSGAYVYYVQYTKIGEDKKYTMKGTLILLR
ncbi:MAG: gliding motility-associated C-terminal domain-containing protein [Opitutaceae bacterium]|nr:gliding motility-associated C-terminal domain-containing protein [Cytophagales bacterium]